MGDGGDAVTQLKGHGQDVGQKLFFRFIVYKCFIKAFLKGNQNVGIIR